MTFGTYRKGLRVEARFYDGTRRWGTVVAHFNGSTDVLYVVSLDGGETRRFDAPQVRPLSILELLAEAANG